MLSAQTIKSPTGGSCLERGRRGQTPGSAVPLRQRVGHVTEWDEPVLGHLYHKRAATRDISQSWVAACLLRDCNRAAWRTISPGERGRTAVPKWLLRASRNRS